MRAWILTVLLIVLSACHVRAQEPQAIQVRQEKLTLPWYTSVQGFESDARLHNDPSPVEGSRRRSGSRDLQAVLLENRYLRVTILPEVGGAVARAVYKPTGDDLFFWEGKVKDWMAHWESGVKVSFPAIHHTVTATDQPASCRILHHPDGSVTVAMWMEFSRFVDKFNGDYWGRYTNMLLSQHVTLRPERAELEVTWRIVNPAPYRQGAKVWNDALFPRNHTLQGVVQGDSPPPATDTEWIFPARYVSYHGGKDFRTWDPGRGRIGEVKELNNSVFAWDIPYGFTGLWYPSVGVNRLRLADPQTARGTKQYFRGEGTYKPGDVADSHMYNFVELWGSPDNLMEGVENWLEPGETRQYTHRYALIKGIGKADFANGQAVIHLGLDDPKPGLEVVTLSPVERLAASLNGKPLGGPMPCAPDRPARFPLAAGTQGGRVVLMAGDQVILDQQLPLLLPDDKSRHDWIRQCSDRTNSDSLERYGDQFGYVDALRMLAQTKAVSLAHGRMQYRAGMLPEAIKTLRAVVAADAGNAQAWHLLGCALLESQQQKDAEAAFGQAISAPIPYPPARYFLALLALRRGDAKAANEQLASLGKERPGHWEGRLLKVWLNAQNASSSGAALAALTGMEQEDPADPRVQLVLVECAELAGNQEMAARARDALAQLAREPGAWRRLREFNAATRGVYYPPQRMQLEGR